MIFSDIMTPKYGPEILSVFLTILEIGLSLHYKKDKSNRLQVSVVPVPAFRNTGLL